MIVLDSILVIDMPFQVAGELSNAGQPMRRFMQTFILAPQSPKKYYVHNDIFRYQDEVFHDVATDSEPDVAGEFLSRFSLGQSSVEVTVTVAKIFVCRIQN